MMDIDAALKSELATYERNEWSGQFGGQEVKWFARPLTPADVEFVSRTFPTFTQNPTPAAMVCAIIRKAEYEDETKVFSSQGKYAPILNRLKIGKIAEIFGALFVDNFAETDEAFEDRVGN